MKNLIKRGIGILFLFIFIFSFSIIGKASEEVVMMKMKYYFSDKFDWGTKRFIDYEPKYENTNNLYNEDEIKAHIIGQPLMGKTKGIQKIEDIEWMIKC